MKKLKWQQIGITDGRRGAGGPRTKGMQEGGPRDFSFEQNFWVLFNGLRRNLMFVLRLLIETNGWSCGFHEKLQGKPVASPRGPNAYHVFATWPSQHYFHKYISKYTMSINIFKNNIFLKKSPLCLWWCSKGVRQCLTRKIKTGCTNAPTWIILDIPSLTLIRESSVSIMIVFFVKN